MQAEIQEKIKELQGNLNELPMHLYILLWAVSDMSVRAETNPDELNFEDIRFPFSPVPLFDKTEAKNLEGLWKKNIAGKDLFSDSDNEKKTKRQKGGAKMKLPSMSELKGKATQFGQSLKIAVDALDPKKISPDYLYGYTTELFDSMDNALTAASGEFGIVALETTMPDPPVGAIPIVPPIPIRLPARSVFPLINAFLEVLRMTLGVGQAIDPLGLMDPLGLGKLTRIILTMVMVLLDIARGNLYHAIFTSFGFLGSSPMFLGIGLKIIRDAIMLVSPDIRKDLRDLLFKSSKSFFLGFMIWLFTTLSPDFVKAPISKLFEAVSLQLETVNAQIDAAEMQANMGPTAAIASIKLPRIPSDKIPDINNLYALRELVREPAIFCDPKISQLMTELREVPPYALFFDLALIPKADSPEYAKSCAAFKGTSMADNLAKLAKPEIYPLGSDTPLPSAPILSSSGSSSPLISPVSSTVDNPFAAATAAFANPKAALESSVKGLASDVLSKSPLGAVLGKNPLETLANPRAALEASAKGFASDALSKSPLGAVLGKNPLETLANPRAALASSAKGLASSALSKSPLGSVLGKNPLDTLANPQAALKKATTGAIDKAISGAVKKIVKK